MNKEEWNQCLALEPDYILRIEGLDKTDRDDMERVYAWSQDFFHEWHWCMFVLDTMLWEYFRELDTSMAISHQEKRILYHQYTYPRPTFIWAWGLEEYADSVQKLYSQAKLQVPMTRSSDLVCSYRKAQSQLMILCGPAHPYTVAPQNKWHLVQQLMQQQSASAIDNGALTGIPNE